MPLAPLLAAALFAAPAAPDHHEEGETKDLTKPPAVGDTAPDFALTPMTGGEKVTLSSFTKDGPVALVVLRGFPGYQCGLCGRQVSDLLKRADAFEKAGAKVVMIYPGPTGLSGGLDGQAKEFTRGVKLPDHYTVLLDPGYEFTNRYALRWDAPRETAYPGTFVLTPDRKVTYAKVSKSHGGRAPTGEVLAAVKKVKKAGGKG